MCDSAAADPAQHLLLGELIEVTAHGGGGHSEQVGCALDLELALDREQLEQVVPPAVPAHMSSHSVATHGQHALAGFSGSQQEHMLLSIGDCFWYISSTIDQNRAHNGSMRRHYD